MQRVGVAVGVSQGNPFGQRVGVGEGQPVAGWQIGVGVAVGQPVAGWQIGVAVGVGVSQMVPGSQAGRLVPLSAARAATCAVPAAWVAGTAPIRPSSSNAVKVNRLSR
jgi:hypothetical protein